LTAGDLPLRFDVAPFTRLMRPCATHPSFPSLVQDIVERSTVAADRIEIQLSRAKLAAVLKAGRQSERPDLNPVVVSNEATLRDVAAIESCNEGASHGEQDVPRHLVRLVRKTVVVVRRRAVVRGPVVVHRRAVVLDRKFPDCEPVSVNNRTGLRLIVSD
jgi:hypothetical protein